MAGLDDLRKRVEAAEQHFGLIASQSRKYSERLTALVAQMEQTHGDQQREIAALNGRLGQFEQENRQLKSMLMGLLQAIENGGDRVIDHAVRDLEGRVGRLIGSTATAAAAGAEDLPGDEGDDDVVVLDVASAENSGDEEAPRKLAPLPETVALDDDPDSREQLTGSATELLDRVEAAASALLAAGIGAGAGDEDDDITEEIEALLESAIRGEPSIGGARAADDAGDEAPAVELAGDNADDDAEDAA